jgi:hypothetical protein
MKRKIANFHTDDEDHWVADLECGHTQHVRHRPPFEERYWVVDPKLRRERIGTYLNCKECDELAAS